MLLKEGGRFYQTKIIFHKNHLLNEQSIFNTDWKLNMLWNEKIHFVNIDNRYKDNNKTYILLPNGQTLSMPPHVTKVPALMLIDSYNVMYGNEIYDYLKPKEEKMKQQNTMNNGEPLAFSAGEMGGMSDNNAYLDLKLKS